MAIDPICQMEVDESTDIKVEQVGETFYFCCDGCKQKFLNGREENSEGKSCRHENLPSTRHEKSDRIKSTAPYYCPMCPSVENDQPGSCPKCGMALERNQSPLLKKTGHLYMPHAPRNRTITTGKLP